MADYSITGDTQGVGSISNTSANEKTFIIVGSISGVGGTVSTFVFAPSFLIVGAAEGVGGVTSVIVAGRLDSFLLGGKGGIDGFIEAGHITISEIVNAIVVTAENYARSEYTNYAFNSMIQFNDTQYAADDTGIYLLEGNTDNGTSINLILRTGLNDTGLSIKKMVEDFFVGCELAGTMEVRILTDEEAISTSQYIEGISGKVKTRRVKAPLNLLSRYWGVELRNVDGSFLNIDSIEYEIDPSTRR
jgi:hypothetical protein